MIIRIIVLGALTIGLLLAAATPSSTARPEVYALDRATQTPETPMPSVVLPTLTPYPEGYPAPPAAPTPTFASYPAPALAIGPAFVLYLPVVR